MDPDMQIFSPDEYDEEIVRIIRKIEDDEEMIYDFATNEFKEILCQKLCELEDGGSVEGIISMESLFDIILHIIERLQCRQHAMPNQSKVYNIDTLISRCMEIITDSPSPSWYNLFYKTVGLYGECLILVNLTGDETVQIRYGFQDPVDPLDNPQSG